MRYLLLAIVVLSGCLHQQAMKPSTSAHKQVIDRHLSEANFDLVKDHVRKYGLATEVWYGVVTRKFWLYMKNGWYLKAATLAHAFGLGNSYVGRAFEWARNKAVHESIRNLSIPIDHNKTSPWADYKGKFDEHYLREEISIACRYGPTEESGVMAFAHAYYAFYLIKKVEFLWLTMEEKCKLPAPWDEFAFGEVISSGFYLKKLDELKKMPLTAEQKDRVVSALFHHNCNDGFKFALDIRLSEKRLKGIMEKATCIALLVPRDWHFPDKELAGRLFFFSAKKGLYRFAYALIPHADYGDNGFYYVAQEVLRARKEYQLLRQLPYVYGSKRAREYLYRLALEQGRVRFVGHAERKGKWLYLAYNRAIELHKFEWAAEMAYHSDDETLKKYGPRDAMLEAMHADDFFSGRMIRDRFKVSYELYWKTYHKIVGSRPKKARARKKKPACPKDWEVKRTDCK